MFYFALNTFFQNKKKRFKNLIIMLKQSLNLKLSQKLSPQQIQLMKLIQLPTLEFEQRIKEEIEENPALETSEDIDNFDEDNYNDNYDDYENEGNESINADDINIDEYLSDDDIPDYKLNSNNHSVDDEEKEIPFASGETFHQNLLNQLNTFSLSEEDYNIAVFLVGSINDNGYLRRDLIDIVDDLAFTQNIFTDENKIEDILYDVVQNLDPPGVGARDLKECLIIQLEQKKPTKSVLLAIQILEHMFDAFIKKHFDKLALKFNIDQSELKDAIKEIEKLNPKPGSASSSSDKGMEQIIPDFTVRITDGELELLLNSRNAPELKVSREYNEMLKTYQSSKVNSKSQKDAVLFIKQKLDAAKWFIDAIKQRQQTLLVTMGAIVNYQKEYFLSGDESNLKPMILKDIAEAIDMDISTVSRVANSKYCTTPYGTKLIKEFFSESMKNEQGEDISTKEIKSILEEVIHNENKSKPLTDDKLVLLLKEKGYLIARRTIAKYREQLDIPVARLRKEI